MFAPNHHLRVQIVPSKRARSPADLRVVRPWPINLDAYIDAYIKAAGIAGDAKAYLFRTTRGNSKILTQNPMDQSNVYRIIHRRTLTAGIKALVGNHSFRATGIT